MFLAHFSNTGLDILLEMDGNEVYYWFHEADKLFVKLNPQD